MDVDFQPDYPIQFTCNICETANSHLAGEFHRELPNCAGCGSSPRFRGIIHALAIGLTGGPAPLGTVPPNPAVRGLGMSEWEGYAGALEAKFDFINTFYHQEPRLDVTSDDWEKYTDLDFMICTEVFEHVLQPLEVGFSNMRKMLKKGGFLVFSAPFTSAPETTEHFPGMVDFATCQIGDKWLVVSEKADGSHEVYSENVVFHGGPGTVLEMRIFGHQVLLEQLRTAGFEVEVFSTSVPEIGYYWPKVIDRPEIGYPAEHYILLCRAV